MRMPNPDKATHIILLSFAPRVLLRIEPGAVAFPLMRKSVPTPPATELSKEFPYSSLARELRKQTTPKLSSLINHWIAQIGAGVSPCVGVDVGAHFQRMCSVK